MCTNSIIGKSNIGNISSVGKSHLVQSGLITNSDDSNLRYHGNSDLGTTSDRKVSKSDKSQSDNDYHRFQVEIYRSKTDKTPPISHKILSEDDSNIYRKKTDKREPVSDKNRTENDTEQSAIIIQNIDNNYRSECVEINPSVGDDNRFIVIGDQRVRILPRYSKTMTIRRHRGRRDGGRGGGSSDPSPEGEGRGAGNGRGSSGCEGEGGGGVETAREVAGTPREDLAKDDEEDEEISRDDSCEEFEPLLVVATSGRKSGRVLKANREKQDELLVVSNPYSLSPTKPRSQTRLIQTHLTDLPKLADPTQSFDPTLFCDQHTKLFETTQSFSSTRPVGKISPIGPRVSVGQTESNHPTQLLATCIQLKEQRTAAEIAFDKCHMSASPIGEPLSCTPSIRPMVATGQTIRPQVPASPNIGPMIITSRSSVPHVANSIINGPLVATSPLVRPFITTPTNIGPSKFTCPAEKLTSTSPKGHILEQGFYKYLGFSPREPIIGCTLSNPYTTPTSDTPPPYCFRSPVSPKLTSRVREDNSHILDDTAVVIGQMSANEKSSSKRCVTWQPGANGVTLLPTNGVTEKTSRDRIEEEELLKDLMTSLDIETDVGPVTIKNTHNGAEEEEKENEKDDEEDDDDILKLFDKFQPSDFEDDVKRRDAFIACDVATGDVIKSRSVFNKSRDTIKTTSSHAVKPQTTYYEKKERIVDTRIATSGGVDWGTAFVGGGGGGGTETAGGGSHRGGRGEGGSGGRGNVAASVKEGKAEEGNEQGGGVTVRGEEEDVEGDERGGCNRKKCGEYCRQFIAFLFSTVGSCCVLVGYTILGGFMFASLESPHEEQMRDDMRVTREEYVQMLWNMTESWNVLYPTNWSNAADKILDSYTKIVFEAMKKKGWDGTDGKLELQWSFAGALLYSITVVTTIGYGHIAPKTARGKVVTIVYAIFGIPLTLCTITNLGSIMATSFRFLYKYICCGLCCICCVIDSARSRARRRLLKSRRREATSGRSFALRSLSRGRRDLSKKSALDCLIDVASPAAITLSSTHMTSGSYGVMETMAQRVEGGVSEGEGEGEGEGEVEVERELTLREHIHAVFNPPNKGDPISKVSVPIYVSVILMFGYICLGSVIFLLSEDWHPLDCFYFCFITLSTIGFGDFVPGTSPDKFGSKEMTVLQPVCALYLVFGLALIAMCFDLIQEEAKNKFRRLGRRLGLLGDGTS